MTAACTSRARSCRPIRPAKGDRGLLPDDEARRTRTAELLRCKPSEFRRSQRLVPRLSARAGRNALSWPGVISVIVCCLSFVLVCRPNGRGRAVDAPRVTSLRAHRDHPDRPAHTRATMRGGRTTGSGCVDRAATARGCHQPGSRPVSDGRLHRPRWSSTGRPVPA